MKGFNSAFFLAIIIYLCAAVATKKLLGRNINGENGENEENEEEELEPEPDPEQDSCPVNYKRDPDNCYIYYQCIGEDEFECRRCPLGTVWSQTLETCDYPFNVPDECNKQENLSDPEHAEQACTKNCSDRLFSNPNNCSEYYQCTSNGLAVARPCAEGTVWWDDLQTCNVGVECPGDKECGPEPDCSHSDNSSPFYAPCSEDKLRSYYECANGAPIIRECPLGTIWCEESQPCGCFDPDWAHSQKKKLAFNRLSGHPRKKTAKR